MGESQDRKERLHNLIRLAQVSRGWTRAELGRQLGRDPTKVYPNTPNPKLDFVVRLADILEWPVGDVADAVWSGANCVPTVSTGDNGVAVAPRTFEQLNSEVMSSLGAGEYSRVVDLSRDMFSTASTTDERAHACAREAAGWDGLGRYPRQLDAVRMGLSQGAMSLRLRLALQAIQANAQYTLWDLTPALGTCQVLADWYENNPPERDVDRKRVAYVYYVRGNTRRRLFPIEPENRETHIREAIGDLKRAQSMYVELAEEFDDARLGGFANTCKGGLVELAVENGDLPADEAVDFYIDGLDAVCDTENAPVGDWLESFGWWCIFGSNVAMRHLSGAPLQHAMAVFTNKALEIADRLDNWAMRERVFTMQFVMHNELEASTGLSLDYTIDDEERTMITAIMGRFPNFRPMGWKILETARVVKA